MNVIIKPILTEKMAGQGEKLGQYGFIVDRRANKLEIRKAVEQMYSVVVESVNTINEKGKQSRLSGRPHQRSEKSYRNLERGRYN